MDKYLLGDRYATWDAGQEAYYPALDISPYPDDPAVTTYLQDAWATVDSWGSDGTADITNANSKLVATSKASLYNYFIARRTITSITGGTVRAEIECNFTGNLSIRNAGTAITSIAVVAGNTYIIDGFASGAMTQIVIYAGPTVVPSPATNNFKVNWIYIGTGAYLSGSLVDTSGNGNHATIYGGVPDGDGGIALDGVNDYIKTVDQHSVGMVSTVFVEIRIDDAISPNNPRLWHFGIGNYAFYNYGANSISFASYKDASNRIGASVSLSKLQGGVHSLAVITDLSPVTGYKKIYIDGVLEATGAVIGDPSTIAEIMAYQCWGGLSSASVDNLHGYIRNPRIYNRALTAQQVSDLASNTVYTYGRLYNEEMLNSHEYLATWSNAYQFDYLSGTTVFVTPVLSANIPIGTEVQICAGESLEDCTILESGVKGQVLFTSPASGLTNLYVKLNLFSSQYGITPVVSELTLLVEQSTSLYTIATQILSDALTPSNGKWEIDTELQKYPIPYAWFNTIKHREAIGKVAEAAGGVAFQDRYGFVRVQAGNYLSRLNGTSNFNIGEDRILDAESPVSEVKNRIIIKTRPYVEDTPTIVWELTGDKTIGDGESKTYKATFSDYDAVVDCSSSISSVPAGATITSETFYSYGAEITVLGSAAGQVLTLSVSGTPLVIKGARIIEESDGDSIRRNGDRSLTIEDNSMIQSAEVAETIAEDILATTAEEKRDIVINWRGDPTLELGDKGTVTGYSVAIVEQEFNFNGALSVTSRLRKV